MGRLRVTSAAVAEASSDTGHVHLKQGPSACADAASQPAEVLSVADQRAAAFLQRFPHSPIAGVLRQRLSDSSSGGSGGSDGENDALGVSQPGTGRTTTCVHSAQVPCISHLAVACTVAILRSWPRWKAVPRYAACVLIAGVTPASPAHTLGSSGGSRKQSSAGEQPIFSRGPTMDGHGNTLPSSHGLPAADGAARHAAEDSAAAAVGHMASPDDPRLASVALASGGSQPPADVLTVHAAAADPSEGRSTQQQPRQPTHADGSALEIDATAQPAAPQPSQSAAEAKLPGVAHLPQGILRRSRSWAAAMPQETGSSGIAALTLRSMPRSPEAATPANSGGVEIHMAAPPQQLPLPSDGNAAGPHLRRASAPVSNPPSPSKQRRRGLFR